MRESIPWVSLFSPFPFHSVYSVEDHRKHVDWIKTIQPEALVSVKVSTPTDVDMVAVGSYYAGAHIIHLDGSYGGTGVAPEIAKKNIAMPIEFAIPKVHRYLLNENIRDQSEAIPAHHLLQSLAQMRNRGNGKGGGIAAVGLQPDEFGVSPHVLSNNTLLAVAYLEASCRAEVERKCVEAAFEVDHVRPQPHVGDYRTIAGLEVPPPEVVLYLVQPKPAALAEFQGRNALQNGDPGAIQGEFVYQNT
jgi:hypothetical protein